jgi:hypothetical protein
MRYCSLLRLADGASTIDLRDIANDRDMKRSMHSTSPACTSFITNIQRNSSPK